MKQHGSGRRAMINVKGRFMPPCVLGVYLAMSAMHSSAALVSLEEFDTDAAGWTASTGEAIVEHDDSGSLRMDFGESLTPLTDGFALDAGSSGGNFTGSYLGIDEFYGWGFSFMAYDILPSSLYLRLFFNGSAYMYNVLPMVASVGTWNTVTVQAESGWLGPGGMSGFSMALGNVEGMELRVSASGTGEQSYGLDNFEILNSYVPPGGGNPEPGDMSVVPEPNVIFMFVVGACCLWVMARHRRLSTRTMNEGVKPVSAG